MPWSKREYIVLTKKKKGNILWINRRWILVITIYKAEKDSIMYN